MKDYILTVIMFMVIQANGVLIWEYGLWGWLALPVSAVVVAIRDNFKDD